MFVGEETWRVVMMNIADIKEKFALWMVRVMLKLRLLENTYEK